MAELRELPYELVGESLTYLGPDDLPAVEISSKGLRALVQQRRMWREQYRHQCRLFDWRVPTKNPGCWKRYYHQSRRERGLVVKTKIQSSSATVTWRVSLPVTAEAFRKRSGEFIFSNDALGDPIRWQIEVELEKAVRKTGPDSVLLLPCPSSPTPHQESQSTSPTRSHSPSTLVPAKQQFSQFGLIRMWTTNNWTADATRHYYGSHCTISLRDPLSTTDLQPESPVDIDNSAALEFNAAAVDHSRELLIKVDLTLALELAVPLDPFYDLISSKNTAESDIVKVGYCKAIFEVARCKRKSGGMFVRRKDRDVRSLVQLAGADSTSNTLRVEVFQALFNLLGPTSVLLDDDIVIDLLEVCYKCLRMVPVPCLLTVPHERQTAGLLAQNALGTVFNLLVHPLCVASSSAYNLAAVAKLLTDATYRICHFSVITVLLTVHLWDRLPEPMIDPLERATTIFMCANNPLDSDCTGVAWDESDIAAFFIPLLRARHLICIKFATWCIGKYYYLHSQLLHLLP